MPLAPYGTPESPRAQPTPSIGLGPHSCRATRGVAIISWLTADARLNHRVNAAEPVSVPDGMSRPVS
jgi:hypothetical protein